MASPVADSYNCAVGESIAGGRFAYWIDKRVVFQGDSLTSADGGGSAWGLAIARSPVSPCFNSAEWGSTIDVCVTRYTSEVEALAPDLVLTRIGTNNCSSGLQVDDPTFIALYQDVIDWHVSTNTKGILHAVPPETGTPGPALRSVNDWIAGQCSAHPTLLRFADDSLEMADGSYNLDTSYAPDGTHMNGKGKRAQGESMAVLFRSFFGQANVLILDPTDTYDQNPASTQYVTNPMLSGSGGTAVLGASGTVPASWYASGNAVCSIVDAEIDDANQNHWWRIDLHDMADGGHVWIIGDMEHPATTMDRVELCYELRFVDFNTTHFDDIQSSIDKSFSQPYNVSYLDMTGMTETLNESIIVRRGLRADTVVSHGANTLRAFISINVATAFTASQGYIDIRCVSAVEKN